MDPGVPRVPEVAKSRKLAFSVCFRRSGGNGRRCRVGPPDSSEKAGKAGKAGKARFSPFLRVQGPLVEVYPGRRTSLDPPQSHPEGCSTMRGWLGSWSPANVIGAWTAPPCPGPFQAQDRGPCKHGPSYVCMESRASSGRRWVRRRASEEAHLFALSCKSTGRPPGHRRPVGLAGVWVYCVRVPGGKSLREPGRLQAATQYVCMKE